MRNRSDYEDDFDIVPDEDAMRGPRPRWLWPILTAVVALFAFGVGAAFMILTNRMGTATPPTPVATPGATTPAQIAVLSGTATITSVVTVTPTRIASATVTPIPTATPFCTVQVEGLFTPLFDETDLGCALAPAAIVWAAFQPFERGSMLWRSDTDAAYVFYADGAWFPVQEQWDGGPAADRGAPPPGLVAPDRGFGYVWSRSDDIFAGLGWARDQEKGFCALVQSFERGFILRSADVPSCTPDGLYNFATASDWTPLLFVAADRGAWRNTVSPNLDAAQGGDRPAAGISRPPPNGQFDARQLLGATLDGAFADWPDAWQPINAIIAGADQHSGPGDLSANFQTAWNPSGLLIAVRVNDERYREGPQGSDQWQGDGLELQFDRLLAEDFTGTVADSDDYQLGIAFNDDLSSLRGYSWLPYAREGTVEIPGTVIATDTGYQLEALLPWYLFELDGAAVSSDRAYGFNLSITDNDADGPAQQTVLSASPARTTHDDPTEWGTLRLLP